MNSKLAEAVHAEEEEILREILEIRV